MENESNLRTIPKNLDAIMGMVVQNWTTTNPEAVRNLHKHNKKLDNFLFKNKEEQKLIIDRLPKKDLLKMNKIHINKQISLLRSNGMLPDKI